MSDTDAVIAALRVEHDALTRLVQDLDEADLARPSGASEWTVSQVLGHLGSSAVLNVRLLLTALGEVPDSEPPESVWARWNAMSNRGRAEQFVAADAILVERYEGLNDVERADLRIDVGFLPFPVTVEMAGRMRLSEATLHSWDVRVAFDDAAVLGGDAVAALLHGEPSLIGWTAKPQALEGRALDLRVTTDDPPSEFTLRLREQVEVLLDHVSGAVDGTLQLPAEAWLRLVAGRLSPAHTPATVRISGAADLALLRRVFPGY